VNSIFFSIIVNIYIDYVGIIIYTMALQFYDLHIRKLSSLLLIHLLSIHRHSFNIYNNCECLLITDYYHQ